MTSVGSWHCCSRISFFIRFVTFFGLKVLKYKSCKNIFEKITILYFLEQIFYIFRSILFIFINLLHFLFYLIIKLIMTLLRFDSGSILVQSQKPWISPFYGSLNDPGFKTLLISSHRQVWIFPFKKTKKTKNKNKTKQKNNHHCYCLI